MLHLKKITLNSFFHNIFLFLKTNILIETLFETGKFFSEFCTTRVDKDCKARPVIKNAPFCL